MSSADFINEKLQQEERIRKAEARARRALERLEQVEARADRYEAALERIAVAKRPDGTYNLSRAACEEIARAALASVGLPDQENT